MRACPQGILVEEGGYPRVEIRQGGMHLLRLTALMPAGSGALERAERQDCRGGWQPSSGGSALRNARGWSAAPAAMLPVAAIRFRPQLGGSALPEVEAVTLHRLWRLRRTLPGAGDR